MLIQDIEERRDLRYAILAENLKKFRIEKGYSQERISRAIGVTRMAVYRWENKIVAPSAVSLYMWCQYVGVDINRLFMTDDEWTTHCL